MDEDDYGEISKEVWDLLTPKINDKSKFATIVSTVTKSIEEYTISSFVGVRDCNLLARLEEQPINSPIEPFYVKSVSHELKR